MRMSRYADADNASSADNKLNSAETVEDIYAVEADVNEYTEESAEDQTDAVSAAAEPEDSAELEAPEAYYSGEASATDMTAASSAPQAAAPEEPHKRRLRHRSKKSADPDEIDYSRLKKKELLEIMLAQGREIDRLRAEVADLEAKLADRELKFTRIGTLSEASLALTNIFKEADQAAKIYLENIRRNYE